MVDRFRQCLKQKDAVRALIRKPLKLLVVAPSRPRSALNARKLALSLSLARYLRRDDLNNVLHFAKASLKPMKPSPVLA
jgi:hypothetical protein